MNDDNVEKSTDIIAYEPTLSLVGSTVWKAWRKSLVISSKSYKESPKEYLDHCIQLEESWKPADYQQLRIVHQIAVLYWLQARLHKGMTIKTQAQLESGSNLITASELTERQLRSFNWIDKAIIRNIDLLRRIQGNDHAQSSINETRGDREK